MPDLELAKAKGYALRLIDYSPRSEKELRNRLAQRKHSSRVIDKLASDFKKEGLIDDERFARLWARTRFQTSPRGLSFIKQELLSKGVEPAVVEEAIEELKKDFSEEEVAREVLRKRLRLVTGLDKTRARNRLFGYLKRRGFSSEIIYKLLNETSVQLSER